MRTKTQKSCWSALTLAEGSHCAQWDAGLVDMFSGSLMFWSFTQGKSFRTPPPKHQFTFKNQCFPFKKTPTRMIQGFPVFIYFYIFVFIIYLSCLYFQLLRHHHWTGGADAEVHPPRADRGDGEGGCQSAAHPVRGSGHRNREAQVRGTATVIQFIRLSYGLRKQSCWSRRKIY